MTPDQLISTIHRQRADQIALRQALTDLAQCLAPEQRARWLSALATRTATARAAAQKPGQQPDLADGLLQAAKALEFLHRSIEQG